MERSLGGYMHAIVACHDHVGTILRIRIACIVHSGAIVYVFFLVKITSQITSSLRVLLRTNPLNK